MQLNFRLILTGVPPPVPEPVSHPLYQPMSPPHTTPVNLGRRGVGFVVVGIPLVQQIRGQNAVIPPWGAGWDPWSAGSNPVAPYGTLIPRPHLSTKPGQAHLAAVATNRQPVGMEEGSSPEQKGRVSCAYGQLSRFGVLVRQSVSPERNPAGRLTCYSLLIMLIRFIL